MKKIPTVSGPHPLVTGAVISVVVLGLMVTAVVAGWLPVNKHHAPARNKAPVQAQAQASQASSAPVLLASSQH